MPSIYERLRHTVKGSYPLVCVVQLVRDALAELRYRAGQLDLVTGTHADLSVDESIAYSQQVFADYKHYAGVERFHGRVAEVGPGDNCGVGLLFLNDGCESIDLVDRFYASRDVAHHATIYDKLGTLYPSLQRLMAQGRLTDDSTFPGIRRCYGASASAEEFFLSHTGYDFIVSRAVLEHVYDPILAIKRMAAALNPAGMMLHKVDLKDHGLLSDRFHELKFLEVPEVIYRRMTRARGYPNRVLTQRYRLCLDSTGLDYQILVTSLAGVGEIEPHLPYEAIPGEVREKSCAYVRAVRPELARPFREMADEELSVSGILLVAKRV